MKILAVFLLITGVAWQVFFGKKKDKEAKHKKPYNDCNECGLPCKRNKPWIDFWT